MHARTHDKNAPATHSLEPHERPQCILRPAPLLLGKALGCLDAGSDLALCRRTFTGQKCSQLAQYFGARRFVVVEHLLVAGPSPAAIEPRHQSVNINKQRNAATNHQSGQKKCSTTQRTCAGATPTFTSDTLSMNAMTRTRKYVFCFVDANFASSKSFALKSPLNGCPLTIKRACQLMLQPSITLLIKQRSFNNHNNTTTTTNNNNNKDDGDNDNNTCVVSVLRPSMCTVTTSAQHPPWHYCNDSITAMSTCTHGPQQLATDRILSTILRSALRKLL